MPVSPPAAVRNRLLASLPPEALAEIMPKFTFVVLTLHDLLYEQAAPIDSVYFVDSGMVSMVAHLAEGVQAEVGVVGCEGMIGLPLLAEVNTSYLRSMVQIPGTAWRMAATRFRWELDANVPFRTRVLRYSEAFRDQITQTAACNGRHRLEQRLARWILMAHDRANGDDLHLTHDFIGMMLGAHRPSITVSARTLRSAGLIEYSNGHLKVVDRSKLEDVCCECYDVVQRRFAMLLGKSVEY